MPRKLRCPNCHHELNNRFLLVFQIKNVGDKKLPCKQCGYELVDTLKLMKWVLMQMLTLLPLGLVLGQARYGLLYIFPMLLILWIWSAVIIPLKKEVKKH